MPFSDATLFEDWDDVYRDTFAEYFVIGFTINFSRSPSFGRTYQPSGVSWRGTSLSSSGIAPSGYGGSWWLDTSFISILTPYQDPAHCWVSGLREQWVISEGPGVLSTVQAPYMTLDREIYSLSQGGIRSDLVVNNTSVTFARPGQWTSSGWLNDPSPTGSIVNGRSRIYYNLYDRSAAHAGYRDLYSISYDLWATVLTEVESFD